MTTAPIQSRQHGRKPTSSKEEEDVYIINVFGLAPQYDWQDLKDRVRKTGARHFRRAHVFAPNSDGEIQGLCEIKGKEAALRTYDDFVSGGVSDRRVRVGLVKKTNGNLRRIRDLKESKQPQVREASAQNETNRSTPRPLLRSIRLETPSARYNSPQQYQSSVLPVSTAVLHSPRPIVTNPPPMPPRLSFPSQYSGYGTNRYELATISALGPMNSYSAMADDTPPPRAIIIDNIPGNVKPSHIETLLQKRLQLPSSCKYIGTVSIKASLTSAAAAQTAQRELDGMTLGGREIRVNFDPVARSTVSVQNFPNPSPESHPRPQALPYTPIDRSQTREGPLIVDGSKYSARRTRLPPDSDDESVSYGTSGRRNARRSGEYRGSSTSDSNATSDA